MGLFSVSKTSKTADTRLADSMEKEISKFKKEVVKAENMEKEFHKFTKFVNKFMSKAFDLHYKFTYDDLKNESAEKELPENIEKNTKNLLDAMADMEFDSLSITPDKLIDAASLFSDLLSEYSGQPVETKKEDIHQDKPEAPKPRLFSLFRRKKKELKETEIEDLPDFSLEVKETPKEEKELHVEDEIVELDEPEDAKIRIKDAPVDKIKSSSPSEEEGFMVSGKKEKKAESGKKTKAVAKKEETALKLEKLPKFKVSGDIKIPKKLVKSEEKMMKNLGDIVQKLEREKDDVKEKLGMVKKEEKFLEKEKKILDTRSSKRDLPEFIMLEKNLEKELAELEKTKKELTKKEADIKEKLHTVSVMEKNLNQWSKRLIKDDEQLEERKEFVNAKEKVLDDIKRDLEEKYNSAIVEIDKVKEDLKEKEENFLKLQDFYRARERRLSHEEGNLLEEKRRFSRTVAHLLHKHRKLVDIDLAKCNEKLQRLSKDNKKADNLLNIFEKKYAMMRKEKESLTKSLQDKQRYFNGLEKDFRKKDKDFAKLNELLDMKHKNIREKMPTLDKFEKTLEETEEIIKERNRSLELKELDLNYLERDIEKLEHGLTNKAIRLDIGEKQLEKRAASFDRLKKDVQESINSEKKSIQRIANKLSRKGYNISRDLHRINETEKGFDQYQNSLFDMAHKLNEDESLHINEISITHEFPEIKPGDPNILDILRLLNIARDFIRHNQDARARDAYLEIQRIFDRLEELDKEEVYEHILEVFKPRTNEYVRTNEYSSTQVGGMATNIDSLIRKFQDTLDKGDTQSSGQIYSQLQESYSQLSPEEKERYYTQIMQIYNRVMQRQSAVSSI
ncbi:hypothetical protein JXC34_00465 [Candidatus Woesearchaeota archaeon]|nr:hypothetical protein [Candidatus Woesearchaeota archaeon]